KGRLRRPGCCARLAAWRPRSRSGSFGRGCCTRSGERSRCGSTPPAAHRECHPCAGSSLRFEPETLARVLKVGEETAAGSNPGGWFPVKLGKLGADCTTHCTKHLLNRCLCVPSRPPGASPSPAGVCGRCRLVEGSPRTSASRSVLRRTTPALRNRAA